jgi:hypothetical protein
MVLPPNFRLVLTESNTTTIVRGSGAYVYDKNGKLIAVYPEMGDPIFYRHAEIIKAMTAVIEDLEGVKGVEELRAIATKTLALSVDTVVVATEANTKSRPDAHYMEEEISKLDPQPDPPDARFKTRWLVVIRKCQDVVGLQSQDCS